MKQSGGILLYKTDGKDCKVLLVHPSGAYNAEAPWSLPKGEFDAGEQAEDAARRELTEECGIPAPEQLVSLGSSVYKSKRKQVFAFAGQWAGGEPRCASWEIDKAEWLSLQEAEDVLHPDQKVFITRFKEWLCGH